MSIKKPFVEVHSLLCVSMEENPEVTVSELMDQIVELMNSTVTDKCSRTNEKGELEIFCWYHKVWENTTLIEYGSKKNSTTGLNQMCKVGVNTWTKQQRDFKNLTSELGGKMRKREIDLEEFDRIMTQLENDKDVIITREEFIKGQEDKKEEKRLKMLTK